MKSRAIIVLAALAMMSCGLYGQGGTNCCNNLAISGQTTTCQNEVGVPASGSNAGGNYCQASQQQTNFTCTSTDPNNGTSGKSCGSVPTMTLNGTGSYGWDSSGNFHACEATYASPNNPSNAPTNPPSSSGTQSSYTNAVTSYSGYANGACTASGPPKPATSTCPIVTCATSTCSPPGAAPTCTDGSDAVWDTSTCSWTCASGFCPHPHCLCDPSSPDPCCCGGSPILIDTGGRGFALTNAQSGVQFDISGKGYRFQIGWTAPGAQNAFLCLPDANGCNSGKQLFGNFTPQPPSSTLNGFAALAVYDLPANGGNGDGIIDSRDAIFSRLRLWIDANHDGISQPNELFSLPQLGVTSISLNYKWDQRTDQYGNTFRYRAAVGSTDGAGRMAYDVFFVMQSGTAAALKACPPRPLLMKTPAEKKILLR